MEVPKKARRSYNYSDCGKQLKGVVYMDNYNIDKVIWKDLIGYEGRYLIGSNGDIINSKGLLMKQSLDSDGYKLVSLYNGKKKTFRVHRLVAENFIRKIPKGMEVNHIDYNRANNHVENLEIISHLENVNHSYDRIANTSKNKRNSKITVKEVREIRDKYSTGGYTQVELAEMYGLKKSAISDLLNGKSWKI